MKHPLISEILLVFILISQFSCGQPSYLDSNQSAVNSKLRSNLQGDWYLSETEFVDNYAFDSDTSNFFTDHYEGRKIRFGMDSIRVHPSETRFYTGGIRNYMFKIEYDTLLERNSIKLFEGRKRKQRELDWYEVVKCTRDELILKSFQYLNSSVDLASFSIYYTYRREGVDSLLEVLDGYWYHCSKDFKSIWSNSSDVTTLKLNRVSDTTCSDSDNYLTLHFYRNRRNNQCSVSMYHSVVGGGYVTPFEVDPNKELLYFGRHEVIVYNIVALNENELILTLNKARTESLQKRAGTD